MNLRVVFMGSPAFAVPTLRALHSRFQVVGVVTRPDKPKGRGQKEHPTAVKAAGLDLGLPVREFQRPGDPDSLKALQDWNPDVIVVVAYGRLLPAVVLQLAPMGCVNVHASLLPRHRGASPIPAAILAGDPETGVSTMLLDEGMDTGDVLLKKSLPIEETDTAGSLHDKLMQLGADLAVETLQKMKEENIRPIPQDPAEATHTRPLSKQDGCLDWTADAEHLDRVVRAMNPWPVAYFSMGNDEIKVWRAAPMDGEGEAGRLVKILGDGIAVGTGRGLLSLREVQAPGKKRVSATDFARGRRLHAGDVFD